MKYSDIKQCFLNFFAKNMKSENIQEALEKEFHIMPELLYISEEFSNAFKTQSFINAQYLKDIKKIIELTDKNNINLIFMKGIFYAADLYENYNYRFTSDLDVLTRKEDLNKLDECLRDIGYIYKGDVNLIGQSEKGHLKYTKPMGVFGKLLIEVHTSVCNPAKYYTEYTQKIFDNACRQECLNLYPTLEGAQDRIIHSCLHFFMHLKELYSYKLLKLSPRIKWQTLFDIVLMVNKYNIDKKYLYYIAKKNKCGFDLFIPFKLINYIIPCFIEKDILIKLKNMGLESETMEKPHFKKLLIDNIEGRRLDEKLINLITFDYNQIIMLFDGYQETLSYQGEDYKVDIGISLNGNNFIFGFSFNNLDLSCCSLVIHFTSLNKQTNDICLEKVVCSFIEEAGSYLPLVKMPYNDKFTNEIKAIKTNRQNNLQYKYIILREKFIEAIENAPNKIISFSAFLEGKNTCLTGADWDDFTTMRHLKMKI